MKFWENFRFVLGYLRWIDELPETAQKLGLSYRTAAVLNAELDKDDTPDIQVYWDIIDAFIEAFTPDNVEFEIDVYFNKCTVFSLVPFFRNCAEHQPTKCLVFNSVPSMREYVERRSERGVPFDRAFFYKQDKVIAFIIVEPYALCGGPFPYHDSWTFAIYRETDDMTRLREACYRVCEKHGLPIEEEMQGLDAPEAEPRWRRFIRWLLR
jgi:hypothetical protein